MSLEFQPSLDAESVPPAAGRAADEVIARARRPLPAPVSEDSRLAIEIRDLVEHGEMDQARERFGALVAAHQRRATRIAFQYLRDASEADEAVQDRFVQVVRHITSSRGGWAFGGWVTPD